MDKKFVNSFLVGDYEILTENGFKTITHIHQTVKFAVYIVTTKKGYVIECADEHILIKSDGEQIFARDLVPGVVLRTRDGFDEVVSLIKTEREEPMYDVTVDSKEHTYFTGDFLSHNTTILTIFTLWYLCFNDDKNVLIVANKLDTAKGIFKRIKLAYELLPPWLKPGVDGSWGQTGFELGNGSSIAVSTTSEDTGRGSSIQLLLVDEAAFIPNEIETEFFNSVMPTITASKNSRAILISTPNGPNNKFCEYYTQASNGEGIWTPTRINWWDLPGRDEKWKENEISFLGSEEAFDQEHGCNFFARSGTKTKLIPDNIIKEMKTNVKEPVLVLKDGCYKIFHYPVKNHFYSIGIDVGEGVGKCYSTVVVMDITNPLDIHHCATYASKDINVDEFAEVIYEMAKQWGNPPILLERNGPGSGVISKLTSFHNYDKIVNYVIFDKNKTLDTRRGIQSHSQSKAYAVSNFRYYFNNGKITIHDEDIISERFSFVQHEKGSWKKERDVDFDDRIHAMLWCLFILKEDIAEKHYIVEKKDARGKVISLSDPSRDRTINDRQFGLLASAINEYAEVAEGEKYIEDYLAEGWEIIR